MQRFFGSWQFVVVVLSFQGAAAAPTTSEVCADLRENCNERALAGDCESAAAYMLAHCPRSCHACQSRPRRQQVPANLSFARTSTRKARNRDIYNAIGSDLGVPQVIYDANMFQDILSMVREARHYVRRKIMYEPRYEPVRAGCKNHHVFCAYWAVQEYCETKYEYMLEHCPAICHLCEHLDVRVKCPIDRNARNAWYPGDLNQMFENILSNPEPHWNVTILSRPSNRIEDEEEDEDEENEEEEEEDEDDGPWIVQIDNFFTQEEAAHLITLGTGTGFSRSKEYTRHSQDVVSSRRTSETAWCDSQECQDDEFIVDLFDRMHNLTGIPIENSESLQFLKYEQGAYYKKHHDYIPQDLDKRQGVRILTVFLYLNDAGDGTHNAIALGDDAGSSSLPLLLQGGGTHFVRLNLTVSPKVGRAVLWPNVLNDDPHEQDPRTQHEALPVEQGVKYGTNAWFHQHEYPDDC